MWGYLYLLVGTGSQIRLATGEAVQINCDSAVIVDEAHLARPLPVSGSAKPSSHHSSKVVAGSGLVQDGGDGQPPVASVTAATVLMMTSWLVSG